MPSILLVAISLFLIFQFTSCREGYVQQNGQWSWVTYNENSGKNVHWIEGIDNESFQILDHKNFGADKNSVYYMGRKINQANPNSFIILSKGYYGYAKDDQHVFLDTEVIMHADPTSFSVLEFPYSKDKNDVYCGTVPMFLEKEEVKEFTVTNEDKLMAGMKSTEKLTNFLEFNPGYAWMLHEPFEFQWVITGGWGTGQTSSRKFQGLKEIK